MVETARLHIIPLNYDHLAIYLQGNGRFEDEFKLRDNGRRVAPEVKERVARTILAKKNDLSDENYLFYTFWVVVEKSKNLIVAELGFKGCPNQDGEIEIGYGTMYKYREQGYMTEAVGGMINWAKKQEGVLYILAETGEYNQASIRVLQKNNFQLDHQKGKMKWWRIKVK